MLPPEAIRGSPVADVLLPKSWQVELLAVLDDGAGLEDDARTIGADACKPVAVLSTSELVVRGERHAQDDLAPARQIARGPEERRVLYRRPQECVRGQLRRLAERVVRHAHGLARR